MHKSFGGIVVLQRISFDVTKGEVVCVIGPSGTSRPPFRNSMPRDASGLPFVMSVVEPFDSRRTLTVAVRPSA